MHRISGDHDRQFRGLGTISPKFGTEATVVSRSGAHESRCIMQCMSEDVGISGFIWSAVLAFSVHTERYMIEPTNAHTVT